LAEIGAPAEARAQEDRIYVTYDPLAAGSGYVPPKVMLEFGARSTGEPCEVRPVVCDAAEHLDGLVFPQASPRVMRVERTFWEKATAIHVFCLQGRFRGDDRFARHWHDLTRLDESGYAAAALADRDLARAVARHKALFFAEKDSQNRVIDYTAAVSGSLLLVPEGAAHDTLEADYARMLEDGVLLDDAEPFESVIERCRGIQDRANDGTSR
jgi:hypothetical protein